MAGRKKTAVKKEHEAGPLTTFYTEVIKNVIELKDATSGEVISGPFMKLPSKKIYPDYYQLIKDPISITEIRYATIVKKRTTGVRDARDGNGVTLDEFVNMWEKMYLNASTYNDPQSLIVNDAKTILDFVKDRVEKFKFTYNESTSTRSALKATEEVIAEDNDDYEEENDDLYETEKRPAPKKRKLTSHKIQSEEDDEDEEDQDEENEESFNEEGEEDEREEDDSDSKRLIKADRTDRQISDDLFENPAADHTSDLMKIYRHMLSFKISHHKNSIPLSRSFMDLPEKEAAETENYYSIVTRPMSFNMIGQNLEQNVYADGVEGYRRFVKDINQIFDNAFDVWTDGLYLKAAKGLSKAFEKRIEKFESQLLEKKKSKLRGKSKMRSKSKAPADDEDDELYDDTDVGTGQPTFANFEPESKLDLQLPPHEPPTFIRKHDVEKAEKVEEIDDITAFIKKFVICTTSNLSGYMNILQNSDKSLSMLQKTTPTLYESIILEPAGNSTIGGSTYSLQLPGSVVAGNEIGCSVFLDQQVCEQKYKSELRVNGEIITGTDLKKTGIADDCFCSNSYAIRVGYGLNFFEFTLKVPFPLNGEPVSEENPKEFIENVKVWLNVTR